MRDVERARVIILEVTIPNDVPASAVLASTNTGLQKNSHLNLGGLEFNVKVLSDYELISSSDKIDLEKHKQCPKS